MRQISFRVLACLALLAAVAAWGCESKTTHGDDDGSGDTDGDSDSDSDTDSDSDSDTDTGYEGPPIPETCEDAAQALTSVGCEFYVGDMDNWDDPYGGMTPDADPLEYSVVVSNPQEDQDA